MTRMLFKNGKMKQNVALSAGNMATSVQILAFCALSGTTAGKTIPSLAYIWCLVNPYP